RRARRRRRGDPTCRCRRAAGAGHDRPRRSPPTPPAAPPSPSTLRGWPARITDAERHAVRRLDRALHQLPVDVGCVTAFPQLRHGVALRRAPYLIYVTVRLEVDGVLPRSHLHRLVDELDWRPDRHHRIELLDVLGIEPRAAVAHQHARAPRNVGAVDAVLRDGQAYAVFPERIIVGAAGDRRAVVAALLDVLPADRLGNVPARVHR